MTSGRSVDNLFGAFKEMVAKFLKTIFKKPSLKVIFEKLHHSRPLFSLFSSFQHSFNTADVNRIAND